MFTLILHVTFVRTLPLFLFVAVNGSVLSRKVGISITYMLINLFFFSFGCYCIPHNKIMPDKDKYPALLISGS
jgi:hypothetical protein